MPTNRGKPPAAGCRTLQSATLAACGFSRAAPKSKLYKKKKFWGQPSATDKKGLYGYVADSSPPPNSHPHPIVRAPDERACLRARGSPGAGPFGPPSTGAAEARRRAEGVGHSMAASSGQSGAAPWCRTIAKLCAVQTTVCHESEVLRHPCGPATAAASRRPWPGAARVEGPVSAATWLILPVVICLSLGLSHACLSISIYTAKLRTAH